MNNQRRTSRFDNIAAILLCFLAVVGCVAMVGVQQAYHKQQIKVEAKRAEVMAKKAAVEASQTKPMVSKKNEPLK